MKNRRLTWLLVLAGALVIARWLFPPRPEGSTAASAAVVRPATLGLPASPPARGLTAPKPIGTDFDGSDMLGDAFALRAPPAPPPAPPVPKVQVVVQAPPPPPPVFVAPPPPPPPFQVIGTWDDGQALGVFVTSPNGTLLARTGTMLPAEYRVTEVTLQHLSLLHVPSQREVRLSVPRGARP